MLPRGVRLAALLAAALAGCSDAGAGEGVVTVTTAIPPSTRSPGGRASATWAAYRDAAGAWARIEPSDLGTYVLSPHEAGWAVAFACADGQNALVTIRVEPPSVRRAEVPLDAWCDAAPPAAFTITGQIANLTEGASWLDFGYALESRGAVLPATGPNAFYEEVNVAAGTWDLAFGVRRDPGAALSRIALVRGHLLAADHSLDVDLSGIGAVTPEARRLVVHGIDPDAETVAIPVEYTMNGGEHGIDLGPQDVPLARDIELAYSVVPRAAQAATDLYRLELTATTELPDSRDSAARGAVARFHAPGDVELTAPPALPPPAIALVSERPFVRVDARTRARSGAASYELSVVTKISNRERRVWRLVTSAPPPPGEEVTLTLPDLVAAPEFDPRWALVPDVPRDVTVTVRDHALPFADGTIEHRASYTTRTRPF
jgi:hypothetical protein